MLFSLLLLVGLLTMTHRKEFQAVATMIVALAIVTHVARRFFGVPGLEILDGLLMLALHHRFPGHCPLAGLTGKAP